LEFRRTSCRSISRYQSGAGLNLGIATPVLVPLSPDSNQMNGLKVVFDAFERQPTRRNCGQCKREIG
jgi:hypothetical protein